MSRSAQPCLFFGWKICWRRAPRPCRLSTYPRPGHAPNRSLKNSWHTSLNFVSNRQYARTGGARDKSPQKIGRIVAGIHPISVNCGHSYPDPIPVAMQSVRILDLATVDINWKMLTVARPASKQDDEFFTKYWLSCCFVKS